MKSKLVMGLVSAGSVGQSFLTRLPSLQAHLGPIKANSSKAAKQAAKTLSGAYTVSHYSALEMCDLIWVAVPESMLERVVRDMAAQMPVHRTMVVLCDCTGEASQAHTLAKAGARLASLNAVEGTREKTFIGEGNAETLSVLKRLLWADRRKLIQMPPGAKPLYFAGLSSSTDLLLPWIDTGIRYLRAAGFGRADAVHITEVLVKNKLRDYENTGPKCWKQADSDRLRRVLLHDMEALVKQDAKLALEFAQGARHALEHFSPANTKVAGA
jgi:predicted short-subunit dehydrogenase-like oxidoreductase (DUF2520 family)